MEFILDTQPNGQKTSSNQTIKEITLANFMPDVIEASHNKLILLHFYLPSSGQCESLNQVLLEETKSYDGIELCRINLQTAPQIAQQFRIQSVPTVIAFRDGQPIEGFAGVINHEQFRKFLEKIGGFESQSGDLDGLLEQAEQAMQMHDYQQAMHIYAAIIQQEQTCTKALIGIGKCYLYINDMEKVDYFVNLIPDTDQNSKDVKQFNVLIDLYKQGHRHENSQEFPEMLSQNPNDWETRFSLSQVLFSQGQYQESIDELFAIIDHDLNWNDDTAKKQLLRIFDALGFEHPLSMVSRKRLSRKIFA